MKIGQRLADKSEYKGEIGARNDGFALGSSSVGRKYDRPAKEQKRGRK